MLWGYFSGPGWLVKEKIDWIKQNTEKAWLWVCKRTSEKINKEPKPHRNSFKTTALLSWSSQARPQSNPESVAGHETHCSFMYLMKLDRAWAVWQRKWGKSAVSRHANWDGPIHTDSNLQLLPKGGSTKYWLEVGELCNQLFCVLSFVLIQINLQRFLFTLSFFISSQKNELHPLWVNIGNRGRARGVAKGGTGIPLKTDCPPPLLSLKVVG